MEEVEARFRLNYMNDIIKYDMVVITACRSTK
jgi:hypothetical protein